MFVPDQHAMRKRPRSYKSISTDSTPGKPDLKLDQEPTQNHRGGHATDTQVASLATRTKVLNTVANTKAAAESAAEQELWSSVGDSVAEHSQSFDKIEARAL